MKCKCCNKEARWCSEGPNACGTEECSHIHCDHCGMHYSLESPEAIGVATVGEDRELMKKAYGVDE